jgi:hypothetical protein
LETELLQRRDHTIEIESELTELKAKFADQSHSAQFLKDESKRLNERLNMQLKAVEKEKTISKKLEDDKNEMIRQIN